MSDTSTKIVTGLLTVVSLGSSLLNPTPQDTGANLAAMKTENTAKVAIQKPQPADTSQKK